MFPDSIPHFSIGPLIAFSGNAVISVLCLIAWVTYRYYRPLQKLFLFSLSVSLCFLGWFIYALQRSPESISLGYRTLVAMLALMPALWYWFYSTLINERRGFLMYPVTVVSLLLSGLALFGHSPLLFGDTFEPDAIVANIMKPESKLLRPVVFLYCVGACGFFFLLMIGRLWRSRDQLSYYLIPASIGLLLWFLGGINDTLRIWGVVFITGAQILWLGSFWLSISLTVAITLHYQGIEKAAREAQAALRESEEKYRTILNSIEEGYYEVDLAGNFSFSNEFLAKSLGYTREELKGFNNRQYMSPQTAKLVFNTFNEVYRTGNPKRDFEWELINKDGTKRFVEVSVSLMRDGKGKPQGFYGTARDISERKHAEEQERILRRARDKVLNHLSHELRTPLSIVQGNIRILKRKAQAQIPPVVRGEIFDILERNLVRLFDIQHETDKIVRSSWEMENRLTLEALDIPLSAGVEPISLYSFAQNLLGEVKEKASHRDIQITLEGAKDLTLNVHPGVLGEMFNGLLRNAIENTPDEGAIRIFLGQKAQCIEIKCVDFGIGVTREDQRHLFDGLFHTLDTELYRSKKPYDFGAGGKGLDLLQMKVYSKRFEFDISVASQRCLYLPTERDLCPGRISECPHCRVREDCFNSGGSTFCLTFTAAGG